MCGQRVARPMWLIVLGCAAGLRHVRAFVCACPSPLAWTCVSAGTPSSARGSRRHTDGSFTHITGPPASHCFLGGTMPHFARQPEMVSPFTVPGLASSRTAPAGARGPPYIAEDRLVKPTPPRKYSLISLRLYEMQSLHGALRHRMPVSSGRGEKDRSTA